MGLNFFGSSCSDSCDCQNKKQERPIPLNPNPVPENFLLKSIFCKNGYTVAYVYYPDCINFEGTKILVYEGNVLEELKSKKSIDPHFFENRLSPIARFSPNEKGVEALNKLIG